MAAKLCRSGSSSTSSVLDRMALTSARRLPRHVEEDLPEEYYDNFKDLITKPQLLDGIAEANIRYLYTPQMVFVKKCLKGGDIFCKLPAKSGKTAIFVLVTLQTLEMNPSRRSYRAPEIVVIAPTRELAEQIHQTYQLFGKRMPGLNIRLFIGGLGTYRDDVRGMLISKQHLHVVVATPGRLRELVLDGSLHMTGVKHFIFDEADRILADERMREDTHEVFMKTDSRKQTLVFSSTYSGISRNICMQYLRRPFVWKENVARDSVSRRDTEVLHRYFYVHERDKMEYLGRLLRITGDAEPERQILVFVDTRERCEALLVYLADQNFDAIQMQGGLTQACRFYCYALAKHSKKKVLVTTDLCARGLDIPEVSMIINFDCPKGRSNSGQLDAVAARDTYHHRANRCGRETRRCLVLTFARDHNDVRFLRTEVARGLSVDILELTD